MHNISFLGKREDRNTVEQLKKQGDALTLNNQRNISNAIDNLSKDTSEETIKFLMNVAQGLRYGTSFELDDKKTNNDWKGKLQNATQNALAKTKSPNKKELQAQFNEVFLSKKELSDEEKDVLALRDNLLKTKGLPQAMNDSKIDAVKNIAKNLDYFVISSEVTTSEKKSCLEKLNKLMSPDYKITAQLKDKKPQVLGELLNDLVVKTPESDMPIIKTTDQRHHGMCAAISTSRKLMAYEYKDKYVNMIMEELSSKPTMEVYDVTKLGTNEKISVPKTEVDFDYADDKGYRILDASALQWMNIAGNIGNGEIQSKNFSAFDKKYFDTFHDANYMRDFNSPKLKAQHNHLRALEKAEEFVGSAKRGMEKREKEALEQRQSQRFDAQTVFKANNILLKELKELMPKKSDEDLNKTLNKFLKMGDIKSGQSDDLHFHDYEEPEMKKQKMQNFIVAEYPAVNKKVLAEKMDNIFKTHELSTETTEYMNREIQPRSPQNKMKKLYQPLYQAAASYRTAIDKRLDIPANLSKEAEELGLDKKATKAEVMAKYEKDGKVLPEKLLRSLQDKFNKIAKYDSVIEKAEIKGEKITMPDLYKISDEEKSALMNVSKNINKMYAEVSRDTKAMQAKLETPLNELAKQIGKEQGRFWVHKEGSSGLSSPEEVRILEQMTGKPYYTEYSVETSAEKIKKGPHSGISGTSVYHNDHGGHAQYIADVAPLVVKDPKTGKVTIKDAIMHDNTWGASEHKRTWLDSKGLLRTDYQVGRGGKDGYITNAAWQNGTLVEDFKYDVGQIDGVNFKMFYDAILPTTENDTTKTASNLVNSAFVGPQVYISKVAYAMDKVKDIPTKDFEKVMQRVEKAGSGADALESQVYTSLDKVNSEADMAKMPTRVKDVMNEVADRLSFRREDAYDSMFRALELDVNMNNVESLENPDFEVMKHFIDTKYNPKDNEAFVIQFNKLKFSSEKTLIELFDSSSDSQLSVKNITPYEAVRLVKGMENDAEDTLNEVITMDSIGNDIELTEDGHTFEEAYFMLLQDWHNLNLNKELKAVKAQNFKAQGVRSAFPEVAITSKEELAELAANFSNLLLQGATVVESLKKMKAGEADKQDLSDKEIDTAIKNQMTEIVEGKKTFIEANIEPKHRNVVAKNLDDFLSSAIKNKNSKEAFAKFFDSFEKYHILNNPKELVREFLRYKNDNNPEKEQMAQVYENYMIRGCVALNKFKTAYNMMKEAGNGHMHEVAKDIAKIQTPAEWNPEGKSYDLNTDEGFYVFLENMLVNCGVDNTLTMINHIGQNDRAMRLEMNNMEVMDELKANLSAETLPEVLDFIKEKSEYVGGLKLDRYPKEAAMRKKYVAKLNNLIFYVNKNAIKFAAAQQQ
ncbi:MAG: hypothetical protein ACI37S_05330 [Candidatus Gastranaerophilaceae bacterium]